MPDDQVAVQITAKVDELQSGLLLAVNAMLSAVQTMRTSMGDLNETAKESESALSSILHIEQFRMFREAAEMSLEAVKGAFEDTVGAAEEFGLSTAKFAAMMGTNEEQAAGLAAALANVGSSTETYETLALRLEKSLRSTGGASKELKDQFKDSNGEFLTGAPLMERLKEVTDSYAEGTARTSVELALLGRGTKAYYDISRVTAESVEHNIEIYKEMGVNFTTLKEKSLELEEAEGDLRTAWKAEQVVIGQELMPVAKAAMQWLGGPGKELLEACATGVKFLMTTFDVMKGIVVSAVAVIMGVLDGLWTSVKTGGKILWDVLSGNFGAVAKDFKEGMSGIGAAAKATADTIKHEFDGISDNAKALWAPEEAAAVPKTKGGKAAPKHLEASQDKGKRDNTPDEMIKDDEKLALAKLALEEDTNKHLEAMGKESIAKYIAEEKRLADAKYDIQYNALQQELKLEGRKPAEIQKTKDELALLEVTHKEAIQKIDEEAETRSATVEKEKLANAIRADDERLKSGIAALQEEANRGQITALERDDQERQLTVSVRREQLARLDAQLATLTKDTPAYEAVVKEKERVEKQFTADLRTVNAQRARDVEQSVNQWIAPMTSAFKTAVADMILHGKTFADAMKQMGETILDGFINTCLQMAEHWAILQIANSLISQATGAAAARTQIASEAPVASANAFASTAAIPYVGLALAPGAAATAYGDVMGMEALVPAAAGGMMVDKDQLAYVHTGEVVLPASITRGLMSMIGGGGQGSPTFNYNPTIQDGQKGIGDLLKEDSAAARAWFLQQHRDGAFR